MSPADRYSQLRETALVREGARMLDARDWSEHEFQAAWFAGRFGRDFTAEDGRAIRIVQFGIWNHEAGPDFAEAAIRIDGAEPLRGSIELDPDARDWEHHGHATNDDYNAVILHIFLTKPDAQFFTRTAAHRNVPQIHLSPAALDEPPNPEPQAKPGRCLAPLRKLPEPRVREVLLGAAQYRLRRKAAALARTADIHGPDEALYQALAGVLGYKSNKLPFTLLAQRLPLRMLRAAKEDADALLFGVAGFLDQHDLAEFDLPTRAYLRSLWDRWWPRRAEFARLIIPRTLWKMGGQRPANHPQRRLAALAQLVRSWPRIRSLRDACEVKAITDFCAKLRDEYWDHHYTVTSGASAARMALVGKTRVTEMLVNVFLPLATADDPQRWITFQNLPAPLSNRRVEIAALRLFGESPLGPSLLKSAAMQQGLLQIYEDFCQRDATDCEQCRFPSQLAKW